MCLDGTVGSQVMPYACQPAGSEPLTTTGRRGIVMDVHACCRPSTLAMPSAAIETAAALYGDGSTCRALTEPGASGACCMRAGERACRRAGQQIDAVPACIRTATSSG